MQFGKAFSSLIYYIAYLRSVHPDEKILLTKVDWKSAYRRIHLQADMAAKSYTCLDGLLLLALRMTFGGSPNPSEWNEVSEVMTDLANDLARRLDWDPRLHCSPHQGLLASRDAVDNDESHVRRDRPFGPAKSLAVNYPDSDDFPRYECYLDDIFGAFLERFGARGAAAIPLALHMIGRPRGTEGDESFPRDDLLAISKFLAEAKPSKSKVILGWRVNTRLFNVSLPAEKHLAWKHAIQRILDHRREAVPAKALEKLMGRLNHAAFVVPLSRHFTGRLYQALSRAQAVGSVLLNENQIRDLVLWIRFLDTGAEGISVNRLVCRWPTRVIRVDACPQGIGGVLPVQRDRMEVPAPRGSLGPGVAQRPRIPSGLRRGPGRTHSRALVDVRRHDAEPRDSTSASGWVRKSSFSDACPIHLAIARAFATLCMEKEINHYTQWFPGKKNHVADALSRDFAIPDRNLTRILQLSNLPLLPQNFRIIRLDETLISHIGDLLRLLPKMQVSLQPESSALVAGLGTSPSPDASDSSSGLFSRGSRDGRNSNSSPASPPPYEEVSCWVPTDLVRIAMDQSPEQFVPPSTVWLRPTGFTNLRAPSTVILPDDLSPFWPSS